MGLTSWFSRSPREAPAPDLRSQLITLVARKDLAGLARLVREQHDAINAGFADWMTVPNAMREDPPLLEKYGEMLMAVARIFEREGDASLVKRLEGDPQDRPVEIWNEQIAIAASLSEQDRHAEAAQVLGALADRLGELRGSAVDFYQPRVLGKLGIARYRAGDHAGAVDATRRARDICRRLGDDDGVTAYETNLEHMGDA